MRTSVIYGLAIAAHVGFFGVVVAIPQPVRKERVAVTIREVKKAQPKPEPKPAAVEPPRPKPAARKVATATPRPAAAPPPPAPTAAPRPAAPVADFGLTLASGDGPAIASARPAAAPKSQAAPEKHAPRPKVLAAVADEEAGCPDPAVKPKPVNIVQPAYTDDARTAQIEGKVRIEITVGADGAVTEVRVLAGLGHGLDEAALAAAKASTFEPGTSCGKPITMTFTIGMRFSL